GALIMAVSIGLAGVAPILATALLAMAVGGSADGVANVAEETLVQQRGPDAVRSRVVAATEAMVLVCLGLSFGFSGFLPDAVGPRWVDVISGAVFVVGALPIVRLALRERRYPACAGAKNTSSASSSSMS